MTSVDSILGIAEAGIAVGVATSALSSIQKRKKKKTNNQAIKWF